MYRSAFIVSLWAENTALLYFYWGNTPYHDRRSVFHCCLHVAYLGSTGDAPEGLCTKGLYEANRRSVDSFENINLHQSSIVQLGCF